MTITFASQGPVDLRWDKHDGWCVGFDDEKGPIRQLKYGKDEKGARRTFARWAKKHAPNEPRHVFNVADHD